MNESSDQLPASSPRHTFGVRQLLIAIAIVAVPMAFFSRYWNNVNNTVDDRTIPFGETAVENQALLYLTVASMVLISIGLIAWLLTRRSYLGVAVVFGLYLLCFPVLASFTKSRIIDPEQGNRVAEVHNDAAAIAATAVERYYGRTGDWPRNWNELDADISDVVDEVMQKHDERSTDPFSSAADPFSSNPTEREESQSIFSRAPDLRDVTASKLRELVDINFDADPVKLGQMNWFEFDGIVPHKPAYNTYRVEFGKLIARLSGKDGARQQPSETNELP